MNGLEKVKHLFQTSNRASFVTASLSRTKKRGKGILNSNLLAFKILSNRHLLVNRLLLFN